MTNTEALFERNLPAIQDRYLDYVADCFGNDMFAEEACEFISKGFCVVAEVNDKGEASDVIAAFVEPAKAQEFLQARTTNSVMMHADFDGGIHWSIF